MPIAVTVGNGVKPGSGNDGIGVVDVGEKFGLPRLPQSHVVMYSRVRDPRSADALRTLAKSLARG